MDYLGKAAKSSSELSIHCTVSVSERTGVSELVAKALTELVERRPEDPLSYLAKQYPLLLMQTCSSFGLETPVVSLCSLNRSDLIFIDLNLHAEVLQVLRNTYNSYFVK